ncbi:putative c6 finger domain-protein [Phialemonium atrogriseum]|uniref:C6 finger domain-protein n=1 Tax=Phialemonium atrogriseum TaxID=1093897 RepID=A0AAJ0C6N9_9PEZI|nr:putative c6 finger domain-protein [Phialemonium atrogriseum]KAK1769968.1 putative c6 finger domain-protein [Phialemonium atrogriseum]
MGRPRKRPIAQSDESRPGHPVVVPAQDSLLDGTMDLDMAFLDMDDSSLSFLDLLVPDPSLGGNPVTQGVPGPSSANPRSEAVPTASFWQIDSLHLDSIDFGQTDVPVQPTTLDEEFTLEQAVSSVSTEAREQIPDLSPQDSSNSEQETLAEADPTICSCLARLYLALDSLQRLPKDVSQAMRVARTAAKTAHDSILCPICASPPIQHSNDPPIQSVQNLMVLGGLLPSISFAYRRILQMVEDEAAKADREGRKLTFALQDYGGLWGQLAAHNNTKHCSTLGIEGAVFEPHIWRVLVRSLLRIDVYGLSPDTPPGEAGPCSWFQQPGLKDIIAMMEDRSRRRHEQIDAMVAAGTLVFDRDCGHGPLSSGEKPNCLRIVDFAKQSMRELIIP